MQIIWTKNIKDPEEKVRFENSLIGSRHVINRLKEILKEIEEEDLDRSEIDPKVYDSPSWSHKQAHKNGFRQALRIVDTIITLDPKERN